MCSALYLILPRVGTRRSSCSSNQSKDTSCSHWRRRKRKSNNSQLVLFLQHLVMVLLFVKSTSCSESLSSIQFTHSEYSATIPENSIGKVYIVPETKMGIYSPNTDVKIRFRIKSGDPEGFFKAESERVGDFVFLSIRTRTNNLNVLNRERTDRYELDIRARIKSNSRADRLKHKGKETRTRVHVKITDRNDLDPFFQPSRYSFTVPEDATLYSNVGKVHAEDADEGINGEIYYSIMQSNEENPTFAIDPLTGMITVTRPLSFKEKSSYVFNVKAEDRGEKPVYAMRQADTASVRIEVVQVRFFFFQG